MPEATIEVKNVYDPLPYEYKGKMVTPKNGRIITPDGAKYGVIPGMLGLFKVGGVYKIFYEEGEWQGNKFNTVKSVTEVTPPPSEAASPVSGGKHVERDEQIWVNSMLQRAIEKDKVDPLDEEACVWFGEVQKRVHRRLFYGAEADAPAQPPKKAAAPSNSGQKPSVEFDDQVPF